MTVILEARKETKENDVYKESFMKEAAIKLDHVA